MSDCCLKPAGKTRNKPQKSPCPGNGKRYSQVPEKTIYQHLKQPWEWSLKPQTYYFCSDPQCDVVYFGQDGSVIEKSALRTVVGIKETSEDAVICYCFGVTKKDALSRPDIKQFVVEKTKAHFCACDVRNPSGKCCLKDFPKN